MVLGLVGYLISFHFVLNIKIIFCIIFVLAIIFLSENAENRPISSSFNSNMMSSFLPLAPPRRGGAGRIFRALAHTFTASCIYLKNKKGIYSEEIAYSKNIITSNLNLLKMFKIVLGLIFLLIYIVTGLELSDVFCQGMDSDGDDGGDNKKEGSGPTNNLNQSSNSGMDDTDDYLNSINIRLQELMIRHTEKTFLKNINEELSKEDLLLKDDSELSEGDRERRDELLKQRDKTVDFIIQEIEAKTKLENDSLQRDNSNAPSSSSNKRNIVEDAAEESSSKKRK